MANFKPRKILVRLGVPCFATVITSSWFSAISYLFPEYAPPILKKPNFLDFIQIEV
jgi:hypothetical protein